MRKPSRATATRAPESVTSQGTGNVPFRLTANRVRLVNEHLGLVHRVVSRMSAGRSGNMVRRLGDGAVSAGNVALARAAQNYNATRGTAFKTVATRYILTAVADAIDSHFGEGGRKAAELLDPSSLPARTPQPDDVLAEQEEHAARAQFLERVRAVLGEIPSTHAALVKAARRLGLSACGSTTELAGRVAERLRQVIEH